MKDEKELYNLKGFNVPVMQGWMVWIFSRLVYYFGAWTGLDVLLLNSSNLFLLRQRPSLSALVPTYYPLVKGNDVDTAVKECDLKLENLYQEGGGLDHSWHPSSITPSSLLFHRKYLSGELTPTQVAHNIIGAIKESNTSPLPLNAIIEFNESEILAAAEASTKRYSQRKPLSVLDGVPVAVKDELDQKGFVTHAGTSFANKGQPAKRDAFVVARLRHMGALLIGKTNMHELGFDITTINKHWGATRNPRNRNHMAGGSSGGSASAVAAGLCPLAVGCDGGGSIRVPAAFCGLYGLKPTFGRVSGTGSFGVAPTVGHVGPIAVSAYDLAMGYLTMAGVDAKDDLTMFQPYSQPCPTVPRSVTLKLEGLRLGIYKPFFEHAARTVVQACNRFIAKLVSQGARVVDIAIPMLEETRVAHVITFGTEVRSQLLCDPHFKPYLLAPPTLTQFAVMRNFKATDFIQAGRMRTQAMATVRHLFDAERNPQFVHFLVTPTTATVAGPIPDASLSQGLSDLPFTAQTTRFMFLGNSTGIPCLTVPIDSVSVFEAEGRKPLPLMEPLPVGLQFMASWWQESMLLQLAKLCEDLTKEAMSQEKPCDYDILK